MDPADFFRFNFDRSRDEYIVARSDRQKMSFPDGRLIEMLSPRIDLPTVMWKSVYPPGYDARPKPYVLAAETALLVVRGALVIETSGEEYHLKQEDALRLEAGASFAPYNPGQKATESVEASSTAPL